MDASQDRVFTVGEIASWIDGKVEGDPDCLIRRARPLNEAQQGDVTFLEKRNDPRALEACQASAVIAANGVARPAGVAALIRVDEPLYAFCTVFRAFYGIEETRPVGIDPRAVVDPTATLGDNVYIGPGVVIGPHTRIGDRVQIHPGTVVGACCVIGEDCCLHVNVTLYPRSRLGRRVIVHAGAVIGADGFGYRSDRQGHTKVPHLGGVLIEDDVEIGANTTIDRGTFCDTVIGRGTKIDNQVQIAHNCKIGRYNLIAAQVGIAGSTRTGDYVVIAGQVGVRDHVEIGDGAVIGAMSGVMTSVPPGQCVMGLPAEPEQHARRVYAIFHRLPDLRQQLLDLGRRVQALEKHLAGDKTDARPQRRAS